MGWKHLPPFLLYEKLLYLNARIFLSNIPQLPTLLIKIEFRMERKIRTDFLVMLYGIFVLHKQTQLGAAFRNSVTTLNKEKAVGIRR
jgi:hypothetical protein